MKIKYVAEDGAQFDTESECREYENLINKNDYRITLYFKGTYRRYVYGMHSREEAINYTLDNMETEDIDWDLNDTEVEVLKH